MSGETMRDKIALEVLVASVRRDGIYKADPSYCYDTADSFLAARGGDAPQPASDAVLNALRLASNRLFILHLEQPIGSKRRIEVAEWVAEAGAAIAAGEKEQSA